jgi:hypothetical protein
MFVLYANWNGGTVECWNDGVPFALYTLYDRVLDAPESDFGG